MKKSGFTLAEVLITLAIIGVVAAITIPSIIANNQKQEWTSALQKSFYTINQAISLSQSENGELTSWPWDTLTSNADKELFMQTYILPYLKVAQNCSFTTNKNCFANAVYKKINGTLGSDYNTKSSIYKVQLADGSSWAFMFNQNCIATPSRCMFFEVDVNGQKGPNILGRDTFTVDILPFTNQVLFYGTAKDPYTYDFNTNSWGMSQNIIFCTDSSVYSCGARIQRDGWKMNY